MTTDSGLDARRVALDASQQAAVASSAVASATVVVGAPGTGRTTVAVEAAVQAIEEGAEPGRVLLLAATRRAAGLLRDRVGALTGRTTSAPMVRTPASAAFAVLTSAALARHRPPPTLITGPEQDLVLAELLAGHAASSGAGLDLPDGVEPSTLGLRGFRQELRDLLMRAAERGVDPVGLDELARLHDRPEWAVAARLYEEYLDVTALRESSSGAGARVDPSVVLDEATAVLRDWDERSLRAPRPSWSLVVVDDYQEATAATAGFVRQLVAGGARVLLTGDPDSAVQTFRGAVPGLVGRAEAVPSRDDDAWSGELSAVRVDLTTAWRQSARLREVTREVTTRVPAAGAVRHRAALAPADEDRERGSDGPEDGARVAILPGAAQEVAYVARELRAEHLLHGTPWRSMAVVARSGDQLVSFRRALVAAGVPVTTTGSDVPLRDEPAVAPLLAAARVGAALADGDADPLGVDVAAALMTSPYGGSDAVALRRTRRALRAEELAGGGGRSSETLLVEALLDPDRAATLPAGVRRSVVQVARTIAAGAAAVARPDADATSVLWSVWEASDVADRWRGAALAGGAGAPVPTATSTPSWPSSARPRRSSSACRDRPRWRSSTTSSPRTCPPTLSRRPRRAAGRWTWSRRPVRRVVGGTS
ncbi:UvrD-helicase domain-containing protein [Paraoerskovia sediminicola]|nr:UvrD-helicase domain-containing protein [Paraoerskovia sediminicola]